MPNWTESMQQTFEYYVVDVGTWGDVRLIDNVKSCTISWDSETDTLGSATIDCDELLDECYIRVYLITIQNGVKEKHVLGTFLIQTLPTSFDGKIKTISIDAYTPLIELKEKYPPIGYFVGEGEDIMDHVYRLTKAHMRAPVLKPKCSETLYNDFVADTDAKWLSYLKDLAANANYIFTLDEMGRVLFSPKQDTASLQSVYTFDDGNSSILYPEIEIDRDLYGIPNVIEILCSNGTEIFYSIKKNEDPDSITSIPRRGREIVHRETDPNIVGAVTQERLDEYAETLLRELSSIEQTITFSHGYCPVRVGDCVMLNYERAGITNVKARVISQTIDCTPGCQVSAKAVFTTKLWKGGISL